MWNKLFLHPNQYIRIKETAGCFRFAPIFEFNAVELVVLGKTDVDLRLSAVSLLDKINNNKTLTLTRKRNVLFNYTHFLFKCYMVSHVHTEKAAA